VTEAREEEATGVTQKQWEKQKLRDVFSFIFLFYCYIRAAFRGRGGGAFMIRKPAEKI
jgi:hypothetical protein